MTVVFSFYLIQMAKNYKSLSTSLAAAESELHKAKAEAMASSERVQTLEVELQVGFCMLLLNNF